MLKKSEVQYIQGDKKKTSSLGERRFAVKGEWARFT